MRVIVFAGPTISPELVRRELEHEAGLQDPIECEVRGPAARGDVLAAALDAPDVIAIIDGYFDRVQSVWHKEILWAIRQGIHVFGAASMGALRAAELAPFGMHGIGRVFEGYRDGTLCDDDEVAVVHASAEHAFKRSTEALVNIRATLDAACEAHVVGENTRAQLLEGARRLPYWERSYPALLRAEGSSEGSNELVNFARWIRHGAVDQKLLDARRLLATLCKQRHELAVRGKPTFSFAETDAWHALYRAVVSRRSERSGDGSALRQDWLEELIVSGRASVARAGAVGRALATKLAELYGAADARAVESVAEDFRLERRLGSAASFEKWLTEQRLSDDDELARFFQNEANWRRAAAMMIKDLGDHLLTQVRADGQLEELSARARLKATTLERRGLAAPTLRDLKLSEGDLWRWYFETKLGSSPPPSLDVYAKTQGVTLDSLRRAVLREYCYTEAIDA